MELVDKVCIALLVLAIIAALVVGILYPFVKTKEGPQGSSGPTGPAGKSVVTIEGSILAENTTNFTSSSSMISQFANTIVLGAYGSLKNITAGETLNYGIVDSSISRPLESAYGICFCDNTPVPMIVNVDGTIDIGPIVAASSFNFSFVYSV